MTNNKYKFFIFTGDPGVGKTTLTKQLSSYIVKSGVKTSGFYTEEIRQNRVREGFDIVTLNGERAPLARDQSLLNSPVKHKVGKYGVLVEEFEKLALPCLDQPENTDTHMLVIDEIGKMELFSDPFKSRVRDIFSTKSNYTVLATIPIKKSHYLIENIRNNNKTKLWTITRENRNSIYEEILKEMKNTLYIH